MVLEYLFFASGIILALLIFTKALEMKTRRQPLLLRVISLGDERMKELSHRSAHFYADGKEEVKFFIEKQLPLYARRASNKTENLLARVSELASDYMKESKYFKKSGSISEYFKSLAEGEKKEDSQTDNDTIE